MKVGDVVRISAALWKRMHEDMASYGVTQDSLGVVVLRESDRSIGVRFFADNDPEVWFLYERDVEVADEDR